MLCRLGHADSFRPRGTFDGEPKDSRARAEEGVTGLSASIIRDRRSPLKQLNKSSQGTCVAGVIEEYERCLEIWRAAGPDDVLLPAMSRTDALSFRSRLYRIRAAMGRQKHPYYESAARARISVIQVDTGVGGEELWALSIHHDATG